MIGAIQSALAGLNAATAKIDRAASSIAAGGVDAAGAADLSIAKTDFKANAIVLKTAEDMQNTLLRALDIKA